MFVYSMRASTIKFFGVICIALVGLIALIAVIPSYVDNGGMVEAGISDVDGKSYSYDKIRDEGDVANFLSQFGWSADMSACNKEEVTLPDEFDKVLVGYNEIQRAQGLDLSKYKRKKITRYTVEIKNYSGYDGKVLANVLVYRNKVIGGDICSADVTGFVHGFEAEKNS